MSQNYARSKLVIYLNIGNDIIHLLSQLGTLARHLDRADRATFRVHIHTHASRYTDTDTQSHSAHTEIHTWRLTIKSNHYNYIAKFLANTVSE